MEMDKNTQLYIQGDGITATAIVGQDITVLLVLLLQVHLLER